MRSPQMIGVEPPMPGSFTFQARFLSGPHSAGRFFSPLTQLPFGPRHSGQFSARAKGTDRSRAIMAKLCFMTAFLGRVVLGERGRVSAPRFQLVKEPRGAHATPLACLVGHPTERF